MLPSGILGIGELSRYPGRLIEITGIERRSAANEAVLVADTSKLCAVHVPPWIRTSKGRNELLLFFFVGKY